MYVYICGYDTVIVLQSLVYIYIINFGTWFQVQQRPQGSSIAMETSLWRFDPHDRHSRAIPSIPCGCEILLVRRSCWMVHRSRRWGITSMTERFRDFQTNRHSVQLTSQFIHFAPIRGATVQNVWIDHTRICPVHPKVLLRERCNQVHRLQRMANRSFLLPSATWNDRDILEEKAGYCFFDRIMVSRLPIDIGLKVPLHSCDHQYRGVCHIPFDQAWEPGFETHCIEIAWVFL
jgi:hypothetical protein